PFVAHASRRIARRTYLPAEAHPIAHPAAAAFPKILESEPGARDLALCAGLVDDLHEDAVVVTNPVAGRGIVQRRERIEKTRSQPPQAAVAQSGILLFGGHFLQLIAEAAQRLPHFVDHSVVER